MLNEAADHPAATPPASLSKELHELSRLLKNQDVDPVLLEGRALSFALHLAEIHKLPAARNYVERHHTARPGR